MPRRQTQTAPMTHKAMKNSAYESRVVSWLMQDGWQVFLPVLDHGHQTDILISDGPNYYRLQIKSVEAGSDSHVIRNKWEGSYVDLIIYFAKNSDWGVITPAFEELERTMKHETHRKFEQSRRSFLKEFHLFEV